MNSAQELVVAGAEKASVLASYSAEQISILKNNIAPPNMTDDQLAYCLTVARSRGLDPFKKQVYFTLRNKKVKDGNREYWVPTVTVEPTIDGFRSMAESTGELDGYEGPFWCGEDGEWRDVWLDNKKPPVAAKIVIFRRGRSHGTTGVARYEAYNQGGLTWQKMGDLMLAKCAESLALRKAFPAELGEFYTHEEMGQADRNAFEQLPPETSTVQAQTLPPPAAARVVSIAPSPKAEPAPVVVEAQRPETRKSDGLPDTWGPKEALPPAILLWLTPLSHLVDKPIPAMSLAELELVTEQCAYAVEKAAASKKPSSKQLLALLNAIGGAASRAHHELTNAGGAA